VQTTEQQYNGTCTRTVVKRKNIEPKPTSHRCKVRQMNCKRESASVT